MRLDNIECIVAHCDANANFIRPMSLGKLNTGSGVQTFGRNQSKTKNMFVV